MKGQRVSILAFVGPAVTKANTIIYNSSVELIFTRGHISLVVAFQGPNVILGLYECNYSLTVKQELGAAAR